VRVPAQLVALRRQLRLGALAVVDTSLEHEHLDVAARQLARGKACGQTAADDHHSFARQFLDHGQALS
jgi:hypothetical protein